MAMFVYWWKCGIILSIHLSNTNLLWEVLLVARLSVTVGMVSFLSSVFSCTFSESNYISNETLIVACMLIE